MIIVPYNTWKAITPSDTVDFPDGVCEGIYVGTTGNVVAVMQNGQVATFIGLPAGVILPIAAKRVNSTSTTASTLLALSTV